MKLQLLRKIWPAICGLVVGGLLGGLTGSWSIGALAGGAAWLIFAAYLRIDYEGSKDCVIPAAVGPWEIPDAGDADQQIKLHGYGGAGIGPYREMYRDDAK